MNYTKTAGEKSTVKLTIGFSKEEWDKALNEAYLKTRGKFSVPGFRKGKAPKPVIENYYGKGAFYEEAFNYLYYTNYFSILEKEKANFTAVGEPDLGVEEIKEGEGVTLTAVVPVKPDVEIEKYTGLKIRKFEYNVTDADVDGEVEKLLSRKATDVEVKDRACTNGDRVNLDFSGSVDGEKFAGGTAEGYDLVLGSGSFIPGFEEQVVGMNIGDEKDITVTFPENYQADNLRGKQAVFALKLNSITGKILPELTDEFVKANAGVDTVDEYKVKTRARLERRAADESRDKTESSIVDEVCKYAKVEIPDAMIENEIDAIARDFSQRLSYQGIKLEDYVEYMGQTMAEFRAQFNTQAHTRVLSQLVVEKIVKLEKFTAEDSEVEAKIAEQAASVEKSVEDYKKGMDPRQLDYIKNDIIITKLFDFLTANNEMYVEDEKKEEVSKEKKSAPKKTTKKSTAKKEEPKE